MRYRAVATDYDGTIAHDGRVDEATIAALERARDAGVRLILVTGRELSDLFNVFDRPELFARLLDAGIWGQGFPQPLFCDTFAVENQRIVGERHLKLWLVKGGRRIEAMRFGAVDPLPAQVRAAYRLSVNEFNGLKNIQLNVEHYE